MKNIILPTIFLFFIGASSYGQDKIKKAEESLKKEKTTHVASSKKRSKNKNNDTSSENDFFAEAIGYLLVNAFLYTSYYAIIESPFEYEHKASKSTITKYPYLNSEKGNYSYDWYEGSEIFRTAIENRYIFENSRINGNHLNVDMRFLKRLGLEVDYLQLWEDNPNFGKNTLAIYSVLAKYYRVRTERFDLWWGLGTSYVDGEVNQLGLTYGLGAEAFIAKPISIVSNFNQTLINNQTINKFSGLLNYHIKQYKISGGYEHIKIGSQGFSTIAFGAGFFF